jgi:hypothetical protein
MFRHSFVKGTHTPSIEHSTAHRWGRRISLFAVTETGPDVGLAHSCVRRAPRGPWFPIFFFFFFFVFFFEFSFIVLHP